MGLLLAHSLAFPDAVSPRKTSHAVCFLAPLVCRLLTNACNPMAGMAVLPLQVPGSRLPRQWCRRWSTCYRSRGHRPALSPTYRCSGSRSPRTAPPSWSPGPTPRAEIGRSSEWVPSSWRVRQLRYCFSPTILPAAPHTPCDALFSHAAHAALLSVHVRLVLIGARSDVMPDSRRLRSWLGLDF